MDKKKFKSNKPRIPGSYPSHGGYFNEFIPRGRAGRPVGQSSNKNNNNVAPRFRPYGPRMHDYGQPPAFFFNGGEFPPIARHVSPLKVFARGVPFHVRRQEICEFFHPLQCVNIWLGQLRDGMASGDAIIEFSTEADANAALMKNRQNMRNRYVELFLTTAMKVPALYYRLLLDDSANAENANDMQYKQNYYTAGYSQQQMQFGGFPSATRTQYVSQSNRSVSVSRVYCGVPTPSNVGYAGYGPPIATYAPVMTAVAPVATVLPPACNNNYSGSNGSSCSGGYVAAMAAPPPTVYTPPAIPMTDYYKAYYAQSGYVCSAPPASFRSVDETTVKAPATLPSPPPIPPPAVTLNPGTVN